MDPLAWANGLRAAEGQAPLAADELLALTARGYAEELAAAGVLSHASPRDGTRVLERWFRQGGTAILVGEILGVGPSLAEVATAWEASPTHRRMVVDPRYTHLGAGTAAAGGQQVWVVLVARQALLGLAVRREAGMLVIEGRLGPAWAVESYAADGATGARLVPDQWNPAERWFRYRVALPALRSHWLLGCRTAEGDLLVTDSLTWPAGSASPGGAGRSAAPSAPP